MAGDTYVIGSGNVADHGLVSGRVLAGVAVSVARGHGDVHAELDELGAGGLHGRVDLVGGEAHVDDVTLLALLALGAVLGEPVDGLDNTIVRARRAGAKHLDAADEGLLGDAVRLGGDGAGAVGAVVVEVRVLLALDDVVHVLGAALKVGDVGGNTSVDDPRADALALTLVVLVRGALGSLVGDAGQAPGGLLLREPVAGDVVGRVGVGRLANLAHGGEDVGRRAIGVRPAGGARDAVLGDGLHVGVLAHGLERLGVHGGREALEGRGPGVARLLLEDLERAAVGKQVGRVVQHDDVLVGNVAGALGKRRQAVGEDGHGEGRRGKGRHAHLCWR